MLRGIRMVAIVAMILAGALAMPVANAAPEVVRIADPAVHRFATATTADHFVRMQPRQSSGNFQSWSLDRNSPSAGTRVVNVATLGCLTISPLGPIYEGAPLAQLPCQDSTLERWRIVADGSTATVRFVHVSTGWCMTIESPSPGQYPLLRLYRCSQTLPQRFVLITG